MVMVAISSSIRRYARAEATTEALREEVAVGEVTGGDDVEIEIPV